MSPLPRPKLLVVNDDPASLLAITGMLSLWAEELAYTVHSVRSGEEALREVLQHDFGAILLDVNMPGMDGFETAEAIHQRAASANVPIIFITAYLADEVNRLRAYQNGAVDYLFTPFVPQVLKAKVTVFVRLAQKNMELVAQTELLDRRSAELTKANARLRSEVEGRAAAERRDREKDEFLAMLGHELRNPLAAINSAVELIEARPEDANSISFANQVVQRQSQMLTGIVDDLLNLGRVMFGKVSLDRQHVDLAQMVTSSLKNFEIAGRTSAHTVSLNVSRADVHVDPARFEQIIGNLLDNALKYTPEGGQIDITVERVADQALLSVRDTGSGIEPDLLPRVFDTFVQGPRSQDRKEGGLGLGLALVRNLVSLHDGEVLAESDGPGQGSVFTIRLPVVENVQALPALAPARRTLALDGIEVLLIEDNDDARETMAMVLGAYGCSVLTAPDGLSGIALAAEHRPRVAIVDIGLPGIDGFEVARRMRADPVLQPMQLVALTGYSDATASRSVLAAGFDLHMVKPVDWDRLIETLTTGRVGEAEHR